MSSLVMSVLVVWLVILTVVCVLTVRQIALLTLRFDARGESFSFGDDGLDVGTPIGPEVESALPQLRVGRAYVLHVSASCHSCRELIPALRGHGFDAPMIALLTGEGGVADSMAAEFPPEWDVVRDPEAVEVTHRLAIQSTPFALQVEKGVVTGKAYVKIVDDLVSLVNSYDRSDAAEIAERVSARRNGEGV